MKRCLFLVSFLLFNAATGFAQDKDPVTISPDVQCQYLGTFDVATMRDILNEEVPRILEGKVTYTAPQNAVKLYRVTYRSVVPEQSNRPTLASGILAIPATGVRTMPLISYQHGTLYGDMAPPSDHERSFESRLMVSRFASQGYVVISADYFGFGVSKEKDSYIVLNSQVQASYDLYRAALMVLEKEGIAVSKFFPCGWSQGGVITMAFLERLETLGVPVTAVGTAAAQCDGFIMTNGFLSHPRSIDAKWVTTMFILTAFAFEEYYQIPGLARLPMEWQKAMGNTKVEAISVGADGTHRLAFGRAVPEWKTWFDSMLE